MKYDLNKFPVSDDDEQLKDELGRPANYRTVLMKAASGFEAKEDEKFEAYDVYLKLKKAKDGKVDLTVNEIALLMRAIKGFPIVIAGQAKAFLDQKESQ